MRRFLAFGQFVVMGLLAGCGGDGSDGGDGDGDGDADSDADADGPTFHADVEPLLQRRCQACHRAGGIAPMSLVTYEETAELAAQMAIETWSQRMPPWGAFDTDACTHERPFREDLRLTEDEIALIADWADRGAPEGDPADAPPPFDPPVGLADADLLVEPTAPYLTSGDVDEFPCIVLDPVLAEDVFLDGWHFLPGDASVVHHILFYWSGNAVQEPDFACGPPLGDARFIGGWAPGMAPTQLPEGVAVGLPSGAKLVMQIHYHPGGRESADATAVQLRFADSRPSWVMRLALVGNARGPDEEVPGDGLLPGPADPGAPAFLIPAGATDHTEEMLFTFAPGTPPIRLLGTMAHMHWLGEDMLVGIERASGDDECLLAAPRYDFAWQRMYSYDVAIEDLPAIGPGDRLRIRCRYDNSLQNPYVSDLVEQLGLEGPADVSMGENTYDEMCLTGLELLFQPVDTFDICLEACGAIAACGLAGVCAALEIECATTTTYTPCQYQCTIDASCEEIEEFVEASAGPLAECLGACGA